MTARVSSGNVEWLVGQCLRCLTCEAHGTHFHVTFWFHPTLSRLCGSSYIDCIVDHDVLSVNTVETEFYS
jgi:hypothetical protein